NRASRTELAYEIDIAYVDAQLERSCCNQRLQLARFQSLLGDQPLFASETPVMRSHILIADALAQIARNSLCHPSCIHEDERGSMSCDQLRETIIDFIEHFARHHGAKRRAWHFDREIQLAPMTRVDDVAIGCSVFVDVRCADQKPRDFFYWFLSRREADTNQIVAN